VKCDSVEERRSYRLLASPPTDFSALKNVQAEMLFNFKKTGYQVTADEPQ